MSNSPTAWKTQIEATPVLDPDAIEQLHVLAPVGEDQSPVHEVLDLFFETTPEGLGVIEAGVEKGDAAGVSERAHRLKSASGSVGAGRLAKVFAALEATAGGEQADVRELVRLARAEYAAACAALLKEFPKAP